jgi:hypothetical protein
VDLDGGAIFQYSVSAISCSQEDGMNLLDMDIIRVALSSMINTCHMSNKLNRSALLTLKRHIQTKVKTKIDIPVHVRLGIEDLN